MAKVIVADGFSGSMDEGALKQLVPVRLVFLVSDDRELKLISEIARV